MAKSHIIKQYATKTRRSHPENTSFQKTHRSRNRVRFKLKLKKDVFGETNPDITLEQILTK